MTGKRADASGLDISEHALNEMTSDLDMLHKQTFPTVTKTLEEFTANISHLRRGRSTGRRSFLMGMGGVALVGGVAACRSGERTTSSAPPSTGANGSPYSGDLKVVALAAALENLAVAAYVGALTLAAQHKLGKVPPAVATFVQTAMAQHKDHASAWNGVLKRAGKPAISGTPLTIAQAQVAKLDRVQSVVDVAEVALDLENAAAQTYLFAVANVQDSGGIMTAATILPVEAMHAAILNYVLGRYPVPDSDIGIGLAVQPNALTV